LSIHTVNTHRQRILEKLNADSPIDAIRYASSLNLLG
jgi:DNA-binding NarL/FixJ family response regulator